MKRKLLVSHLKKQRCLFHHEGRKHSVYFNPKTNQTSTVPRHTEINDFLARKICRDLGIEEP